MRERETERERHRERDTERETERERVVLINNVLLNVFCVWILF